MAFTVVAAMLGGACFCARPHNDAAEIMEMRLCWVLCQWWDRHAVHDLVLHNDAAEIHGNEVVLGIVSVVGQACAVHDWLYMWMR